jgi:hypothetical protein
MSKTLTIGFGSFFGFFVGAVAVQLAGGHITNITERIMVGAMAGGLAGLIGGTTAGDIASQGQKESGRALSGLIAGALFGALGGTQSAALQTLLHSFNIRII